MKVKTCAKEGCSNTFVAYGAKRFCCRKCCVTDYINHHREEIRKNMQEYSRKDIKK